MSITSDNRRAAYIRIVPNLSDRENMVVCSIVDNGPSNAHEIARRLGVEVTMVRPRCTMLAKPERGVLTVVGKRAGPFGNMEAVYDLTVQGVLL